MSNPGTDHNRQVSTFAFYDLRNALPVIAAMAVLFLADVTVDDVTVLLCILVGDVVAMFAALSYLGMGDRGERRRRALERFSAALDATERKARRAASVWPLVAAVVVAAIASGGFPDAKVAAAAILVGFPLGQVIFALWLNARRSPGHLRA